MIDALAADLVSRVTTVPALANSAGLALGGHGADPTLVKVPLPAAWVMYKGDAVDEDPTAGRGSMMVPGVEVVLGSFAVVVYLPYIGQDDLLSVQFPLLESVIKAIRGQQSPSGHRWRYVGQKLALVYNDRIVYEQRYAVDMIL